MCLLWSVPDFLCDLALQSWLIFLRSGNIGVYFAQCCWCCDQLQTVFGEELLYLNEDMSWPWVLKSWASCLPLVTEAVEVVSAINDSVCHKEVGKFLFPTHVGLESQQP